MSRPFNLDVYDSILKVIAAAPRHGITAGEIAERTGLDYRAVTYRLSLMGREGKLHKAGNQAWTRYYRNADEAKTAASKELSPDRLRQSARERKARSRARLMADRRPGHEQVVMDDGDEAPVTVPASRSFRDAQAVVPSHVVVQRLPGFAVRGRFEAEEGFVGEFSAEWRRARETEAA